MRTSALVALAAAGAARLAAAHSTVYAVWVNDEDQGLGNTASGYIRSPPNNSPLTDVTSKDMTCNVNNAATAKTLEVKGGDKITFEWHHNNRDASDDIIDLSHKGPVLTYIAPTESSGAGDVWVKLAEEGYENGKWAVENLVANKGKHSITLPDLAAGEYLLRPEIIALHEGNRLNGAQFYMECVQIKVTSSGAKTLPAGVAIPGTYTATDPGVKFDLYNGFTSYPIPGPEVWDGASGTPSTGGGASSAAPASSVAPVTSAAAPASSVKAVTSAPAAQPPAQTTFVTSVKKITATAGNAPAPSAPAASAPANNGGNNGGAAVKKYYQCGGINHKGSTTCEAGTKCVVQNPYYSQCL